MRAVEFLLEYNREKTAQVFGHKLLAALANDNSLFLPNALGTSKVYLRQTDKIDSAPDESNKQIIIKDILAALESADPTTTKEYVQWLAKVYANEAQKLEDLTSKGLDWLKRYHQFKVKHLLPDNLRNIANIKFSQLFDIVYDEELGAKLDAIENAPSKDKGQSEIVFDNEQVRIIVPEDEAAACYYGQGTRWCTAARNNNYFARYNQDGPLYVLLPKQPKHDGEKYQLHFDSGQFMDEDDDAVDLFNLLSNRFGNLVEFFRERYPYINEWIMFAPDEVLLPLIDKIKEAVNDHLWELVSDWETQDDYWFEYLIDKGYVYPEGHENEGSIDWEKVQDADESYTSWNLDASDFIARINDSVDVTPQLVRDMAIETASENQEYSHQALNTLEQMIIRNIKDNNMRWQHQIGAGTGDIITWIDEHIRITRKDDEWDVYVVYKDRLGQRTEHPVY